MWKSWQTVLAAKVKINFCLLGFCYFFTPHHPCPTEQHLIELWNINYFRLSVDLYLFKIITRYTVGSHGLSFSLFSCLLSGTSRIILLVMDSLETSAPSICSLLKSKSKSQSDPLGEWKSPLSSSLSLSPALSSCSSCTTTATGWDPASVTSVSATAPVTSISGSGGVREKECKLRQTYRQSVRQSQPVTAAQRKKFLIVFLTGHTTEDRHRQTDNRQTISVCETPKLTCVWYAGFANFSTYAAYNVKTCKFLAILFGKQAKCILQKLFLMKNWRKGKRWYKVQK